MPLKRAPSSGPLRHWTGPGITRIRTYPFPRRLIVRAHSCTPADGTNGPLRELLLERVSAADEWQAFFQPFSSRFPASGNDAFSQTYSAFSFFY